MKLTLNPEKTGLYGHIEFDEKGRFRWGERLQEPIGYYRDARLWAVLVGTGPPGQYNLTSEVVIDGEGVSKLTTYEPVGLTIAGNDDRFQLIMPIPVANVPLNYDIVTYVDGEEFWRFRLEIGDEE